MRRLLPLALLCLAGADAPPAGPPKPPALRLTRDEANMLLGFQGRAQLVKLQAERELTRIAEAQAEYLRGVAARLKVPPDRLASDYVFDFEALTVEPRAKQAEVKK